MKKIICLLLVLLVLCAPLISCASSDTEDTTEVTLPSYAGKQSEDYDASGNFILTSTDDRAVYTYNSAGYVVFTFTGETVSKIQRVLVFEDSDKAQKYISEQTNAAIENGETPVAMELSGNYVIVPVGFSTEEGSLGSYYLKGKSDVTVDFGEEAAQ